MTHADVLSKVEGAVTTYSDDQQLDAALSEKLARYNAVCALCMLQPMCVALCMQSTCLALCTQYKSLVLF